jgi:hypothetical protein
MTDNYDEKLSLTLGKFVRPSGTSLSDYQSLLTPKPQGRWGAEAVARAEQTASKAPPPIPSGPWSNPYSENLTEPPLGYSIDAVALGDPIQSSSTPSTAEGHAFPDDAAGRKRVESVPQKPIRRI